MKVYKSKYGKLPGTSYEEVIKAARREYHTIQKRTPRRQAHIRSAYFKKDKIFMNTFWNHIEQKRSADQVRRLKFYLCAVDLMRHSKEEPTTKQHPDRVGVLVHRFAGTTKDSELFFVQVQEDRKSDRKDFMSVFPIDKLRK